MQKQKENRALWENYWAERQKSLHNPQGKRRAIVAAFHLLKGLAAVQPTQPLRVIELGCGEGHILGELLKLCAAHKLSIAECVGIDKEAKAIAQARRLYRQISFLVADYARQPLNLKPFDLVLLVGTLHEVYSSRRSIKLGEIDRRRGNKAVDSALCHSTHLIGDNRYLILFDGVEHALPELMLTVRFFSSEALREFKKMASEYEAFHLAYEELEPPGRIRISMHDFTRYITKTRFFNSSLWKIEKRESYQYFSEAEFKSRLGKLGMKILKLHSSTPYRKDWRSRVSIESPGVDFPKENILIVGQKQFPPPRCYDTFHSESRG